MSTEGKTTRELLAIVQEDRRRFAKLAEAWDELTYEYQDRLLAQALDLVAELDVLDEIAGLTE